MFRGSTLGSFTARRTFFSANSTTTRPIPPPSLVATRCRSDSRHMSAVVVRSGIVPQHVQETKPVWPMSTLVRASRFHPTLRKIREILLHMLGKSNWSSISVGQSALKGFPDFIFSVIILSFYYFLTLLSFSLSFSCFFSIPFLFLFYCFFVVLFFSFLYLFFIFSLSILRLPLPTGFGNSYC